MKYLCLINIVLNHEDTSQVSPCHDLQEQLLK